MGITMPIMCRLQIIFVYAGVIHKYHQNQPDSDAATNKIGISAKNWARKCLLSVDTWRMGPIMPWFASGFVMSSPKCRREKGWRNALRSPTWTQQSDLLYS